MVILGAQNRPQEGRRGERTRLRRIFEPKKMSRELHGKTKMVSWPPRSSQETRKSSPEEPKSFRRGAQEYPKGAQVSPETPSEPWSDRKRRFFRIPRMCLTKIDDFEGQRVILGAHNRPQEGQRGDATHLRRRYEPNKMSRELWKALGGSICRILCVRKALGGLICRILRFRKAL